MMIGNIGKDPDITTFASNGTVKAAVNLATSEKYFDKDSNDYKSKTEWHRIVFYGKLATIVQRYLKKGSKIFIEGVLKTRQWEKDGQTHYITEVIAKEMQMLDGKNHESESQPVGDNLFSDFGGA